MKVWLVINMTCTERNIINEEDGVKQIIIMAAMIALGIAIFRLIAGGDDSSVLSVMKGVWEQEIEMWTNSP